MKTLLKFLGLNTSPAIPAIPIDLSDPSYWAFPEFDDTGSGRSLLYVNYEPEFEKICKQGRKLFAKINKELGSKIY